MSTDHPTLPARLAAYLPTGHRLWYAERQGALRHDWLLCACGLGVKLEKTPGPVVNGQPTVVTEDVTEEHWLTAINLCRLAMHSTAHPCLPVTLEGVELAVREAPLPAPAAASSATADTPAAPSKATKRATKKESAHA